MSSNWFLTRIGSVPPPPPQVGRKQAGENDEASPAFSLDVLLACSLPVTPSTKHKNKLNKLEKSHTCNEIDEGGNQEQQKNEEGKANNDDQQKNLGQYLLMSLLQPQQSHDAEVKLKQNVIQNTIHEEGESMKKKKLEKQQHDKNQPRQGENVSTAMGPRLHHLLSSMRFLAVYPWLAHQHGMGGGHPVWIRTFSLDQNRSHHVRLEEESDEEGDGVRNEKGKMSPGRRFTQDLIAVHVASKATMSQHNSVSVSAVGHGDDKDQLLHHQFGDCFQLFTSNLQAFVLDVRQRTIQPIFQEIFVMLKHVLQLRLGVVFTSSSPMSTYSPIFDSSSVGGNQKSSSASSSDLKLLKVFECPVSMSLCFCFLVPSLHLFGICHVAQSSAAHHHHHQAAASGGVFLPRTATGSVPPSLEITLLEAAKRPPTSVVVTNLHLICSFAGVSQITVWDRAAGGTTRLGSDILGTTQHLDVDAVVTCLVELTDYGIVAGTCVAEMIFLTSTTTSAAAQQATGTNNGPSWSSSTTGGFSGTDFGSSFLSTAGGTALGGPHSASKQNGMLVNTGKLKFPLNCIGGIVSICAVPNSVFFVVCTSKGSLAVVNFVSRCFHFLLPKSRFLREPTSIFVPSARLIEQMKMGGEGGKAVDLSSSTASSCTTSREEESGTANTMLEVYAFILDKHGKQLFALTDCAIPVEANVNTTAGNDVSVEKSKKAKVELGQEINDTPSELTSSSSLFFSEKLQSDFDLTPPKLTIGDWDGYPYPPRSILKQLQKIFYPHLCLHFPSSPGIRSNSNWSKEETKYLVYFDIEEGGGTTKSGGSGMQPSLSSSNMNSKSAKMIDSLHQHDQEFILLDWLGSGAFGSVRLAKHIRTQRYFALKCVPRPHSGLDEQIMLDELRVFHQEAATIGRLPPHRNIVHYYGVYASKHHLNVVMDVASEGSLESHLYPHKKKKKTAAIQKKDKNKNGKLAAASNDEEEFYGIEDQATTGPSESKLKSILVQLLSGLVHMHQHLVQHRDVKPANVLVFPDGVVKWADFGVSINNGIGGGTHLGAAALTAEHTVIGTATYAAPEILEVWGVRSTTKYSYSADVWSLGAMIYCAILQREDGMIVKHADMSTVASGEYPRLVTPFLISSTSSSSSLKAEEENNNDDEEKTLSIKKNIYFPFGGKTMEEYCGLSPPPLGKKWCSPIFIPFSPSSDDDDDDEGQPQYILNPMYEKDYPHFMIKKNQQTTGGNKKYWRSVYSLEFLQLIDGMMAFDRTRRPAAWEAVNHPCFHPVTATSSCQGGELHSPVSSPSHFGAPRGQRPNERYRRNGSGSPPGSPNIKTRQQQQTSKNSYGKNYSSGSNYPLLRIQETALGEIRYYQCGGTNSSHTARGNGGQSSPSLLLLPSSSTACTSVGVFVQYILTLPRSEEDEEENAKAEENGKTTSAAHRHHHSWMPSLLDFWKKILKRSKQKVVRKNSKNMNKNDDHGGNVACNRQREGLGDDAQQHQEGEDGIDRPLPMNFDYYYQSLKFATECWLFQLIKLFVLLDDDEEVEGDFLWNGDKEENIPTRAKSGGRCCSNTSSFLTGMMPSLLLLPDSYFVKTMARKLLPLSNENVFDGPNSSSAASSIPWDQLIMEWSVPCHLLNYFLGGEEKTHHSSSSSSSMQQPRQPPRRIANSTPHLYDDDNSNQSVPMESKFTNNFTSSVYSPWYPLSLAKPRSSEDLESLIVAIVQKVKIFHRYEFPEGYEYTFMFHGGLRGDNIFVCEERQTPSPIMDMGENIRKGNDTSAVSSKKNTSSKSESERERGDPVVRHAMSNKRVMVTTRWHVQLGLPCPPMEFLAGKIIPLLWREEKEFKKWERSSSREGLTAFQNLGSSMPASESEKRMATTSNVNEMGASSFQSNSPTVLQVEEEEEWEDDGTDKESDELFLRFFITETYRHQYWTTRKQEREEEEEQKEEDTTIIGREAEEAANTPPPVSCFLPISQEVDYYMLLDALRSTQFITMVKKEWIWHDVERFVLELFSL